MAASVLQLYHHAGKSGMAGYPSVAAVGDLPILAEDTEEVAIGKEDRPRTAASHKGPFFAKMGPVGSDFKGLTGAAYTCPAGGAVNAALARAEFAALHHLPKRSLAALKLPAFFKAKIPGTLHISIPGRGSIRAA
jgi:hypothetical protein